MMPGRSSGEARTEVSLEENRVSQSGNRCGATVTSVRTNTGRGSFPRQVVTLAYLFDEASAELITNGIAESLELEPGQSVIVVRFESEENAGPGGRGNPVLNGEFHMPSTLAKGENGIHFLTLGVLPHDPPSPQGITALIGTLRSYFRHILIEARVDHESIGWTEELLAQSDVSYLFFDGEAETVCRGQRIIREVQPRRGAPGDLKPIGCATRDELIESVDTLAQLSDLSVHMFLRGCPASSQGPVEPFWADVRRLGREIAGRSVGLALSSGAAKGFEHIGVIQVLEENGIEIDTVAGSSMGAYVGSVWAHGDPGPWLERLAREMETRWAMWSLVDPVFPPRRGFVRGFAVKRRLMRSIGTARFAEMARPLRVVA